MKDEMLIDESVGLMKGKTLKQKKNDKNKLSKKNEKLLERNKNEKIDFENLMKIRTKHNYKKKASINLVQI